MVKRLIWNQLVEKLQFMNQKILKDAAINLSVSSNNNKLKAPKTLQV